MPTTKTQQNIPNGWKQVALGDLVSVTTGKRDANHGSPDGQYPFFTCAQKVSKINNFAFDTEAVLIAGNGDFNVKYYKGKFDAYQRTYVLSDFKDTTGPFVYQKAKQALNEIIKNNQGSSVKFIKMGDLTDYPLLLPPLKQQQKIAEILGTVDEDIEKTQELIKATEKLKRGLMQQLFTRGIGHTKFKETKIGQIPEEWGVVSIRNSSIKLIDGDRGANYPKQENFSPEGHCLFLSAKNVSKNGFIFDEVSFISEEKDKALRKGKLERGDIILTSRGTVGNVAYYDERIPFNNIRINSGMLIVRHGEQFDPVFLYRYFSSPQMEAKYSSMGSGSAQPQLPVGSLEQVEVPLIPIKEQKEIANIISAVNEKILINKKLKEKLIMLKKGLMRDLLSGEVRTNI